MKGTRTESPIYPVYDLSNPHFADVEIITDKNTSMKGQFVRFNVVNGKYVTMHPSEKYYFLPSEHKQEFWNAYKINKGEFTTVPTYIKKFALNEIHRITIYPTLIP